MRPSGMRAIHSSRSDGCCSMMRSVRSDKTYPGAIEFTLIPAGAHSTARDLARWATAAFDALYDAAHWGTFTMTPDIEEMRMALPGRPACRSPRPKARAA